MPKFCPFCGAEGDEDSIYCLNCGKKLPERAAPPKRERLKRNKRIS